MQHKREVVVLESSSDKEFEVSISDVIQIIKDDEVIIQNDNVAKRSTTVGASNAKRHRGLRSPDPEVQAPTKLPKLKKTSSGPAALTQGAS